MPREELRGRLGLAAGAYDPLIERLAEDGALRANGKTVALPGHRPTLSSEQAETAAAYVASLAAQPYSPHGDERPEDDLLAYLQEQGEVVATGDGVVFAAGAYDEMAARVAAHLREKGTVTLAEVRDMFGTSRKYAQALLEHMDARGVTRRRGDERVLR
jgi:selenocysteine-specific elongation factor